MLPKNYRLKKKRDFQEVIRKGKGIKEHFLVLKFIKNNLTKTRIGFIVSQKVSKKATVRNRIKRRLRETVRANLYKIKPGYNLVFLARKEIEEKNFQEIKENVEQLLKKARVLKKTI